MTKERFDLLLIGMVALAAVVFAALYFVRAGYGRLRDGRWGPKIDNRIGWILMEAPVFLAMTALCLCSPRRNEAAPLVFFALFQLHYLHRAFIYPMLFKSRSAMPLGIVAMGIVFNLLNACMQGGWIFYVAPEGYYTNEWLLSPQFLAGTAVFFAGMAINIHSDRIIRRLRAAGLQFEAEARRLASEALAGRSFVVSGKFTRSRDEMKELIELHGGRNLAAVSGSVDYLVAGDKMGPAKLKKAEKLGVRIISEEEFIAMIEGGGPMEKAAQQELF